MYRSGPLTWHTPRASARSTCSSATSSGSAGIATHSRSSYGEPTSRISGLCRSTSVESPRRVGMYGARMPAALSPSRNMPSSISITSIAPPCRAARKYGSRGMKSSETKEKMSFRTLPAAHSMPTSAPP